MRLCRAWQGAELSRTWPLLGSQQPYYSSKHLAAISDATIHDTQPPSSHSAQLTLVNQELLPLGAVEHLLSVLHGTNKSGCRYLNMASRHPHGRACPKTLFVPLSLLPVWVILSMHKVLKLFSRHR